jgi:hypothetical protein
LSKDRHHHGISSRELHVVGEFVRRDALQHQLTSVSVFSLVALEWNSSRRIRLAIVRPRTVTVKTRQAMRRVYMVLNFVCQVCVYCSGEATGRR